jgi:pentapeptide repeat protein
MMPRIVLAGGRFLRFLLSEEDIMANPDQLVIFKQGREAWNFWRDLHPSESVDLSNAKLSGGFFPGQDYSRVNLSGANLAGADLTRLDLTETDLSGANLSSANLK